MIPSVNVAGVKISQRFGCVLVVLATAAAQSGPADREYARGVALHQAGDLAGARTAYEAVLKLTPRRIDALSNLGLVYAGLHDYPRAIDAFQRALGIVPGQPIVLFNLGLTYLQASKYEEARSTLTQVTGTNQAARQYLALALLKLGRMRDGTQELELVLQSQPGNLDAAYTLASAYIKTNELAKAGELVRGILRQNDTAEAHLLAGSLLLANQKYPEAVAELRHAQEINPSLPDLGSHLGAGYAMAGSRDRAIEVFEANLRAHPADFDTLAFLGWLYIEADRPEEAGAVLERARKIKPDDPDVLFQLGRLARENGNFESAASLLERVVARRPGHTQAHVLLAQTYFRLKRREDGRREQEIVKRLNEQDRARRLKDTALPGPSQ